MSFAKNGCQQISITDTINSLTSREKSMLEKSWAKDFSERIFPIINEDRYSVLYSEKASRPNTPVNIIIGSLVLKELMNLTDDEIVESLMFDIRFQYALNTTSFEEQPLSDKTLSRFRKRCYEHEAQTGKDLIHDTIIELSGEMAAVMKINNQMKRMDSFMVAANIKKLSRLELLYTCVSNLVTHIHKKGEYEKIAGLEHYYDPSDYNRMIYHNRSTETDTRVQQIIDDANKLLIICEIGYDEEKEYQLLQRAMKEQTITEENGSTRLRTKEDGGMNSNILQNPTDPEATYREKSGKQHRGYAANVIETVGECGSIITDYQYEQNTHSDSQFLSETIEAMGKQEEEVIIVADGAYSGTANKEKAEENNIHIVTTELTGRQANDIHADFEFNEDGTEILKCAAGKKPKSCNFNKSTGQCRTSFHRNQCEQCPNKDKCNPKIFNRTAVMFVSKKTSERAIIQRQMQTEEYKELGRFRNGVETIPSIMRRKYNIDKMPVRGKIRTKLFFGFKIAALNFKKLSNYLGDLAKLALNPAVN